MTHSFLTHLDCAKCDRTYDADRVRLHCHLPRRCLEFLFEHGVHVQTNGRRLYAS